MTSFYCGAEIESESRRCFPKKSLKFVFPHSRESEIFDDCNDSFTFVVSFIVSAGQKNSRIVRWSSFHVQSLIIVTVFFSTLGNTVGELLVFFLFVPWCSLFTGYLQHRGTLLIDFFVLHLCFPFRPYMFWRPLATCFFSNFAPERTVHSFNHIRFWWNMDQHSTQSLQNIRYETWDIIVKKFYSCNIFRYEVIEKSIGELSKKTFSGGGGRIYPFFKWSIITRIYISLSEL